MRSEFESSKKYLKITWKYRFCPKLLSFEEKLRSVIFTKRRNNKYFTSYFADYMKTTLPNIILNDLIRSPYICFAQINIHIPFWIEVKNIQFWIHFLVKHLKFKLNLLIFSFVHNNNSGYKIIFVIYHFINYFT